MFNGTFSINRLYYTMVVSNVISGRRKSDNNTNITHNTPQPARLVKIKILDSTVIAVIITKVKQKCTYDSHDTHKDNEGYKTICSMRMSIDIRMSRLIYFKHA